MTFRANGPWYASLIGLGLPLVACSSSERPSGDDGSGTGGMVLPGGADYQLVGSPTTLDARYVLRSNDGELVIVRNCGPFGALLPLFEAKADAAYAFLNENEFLSSDPGAGSAGVSITFYERQ